MMEIIVNMRTLHRQYGDDHHRYHCHYHHWDRNDQRQCHYHIAFMSVPAIDPRTPWTPCAGLQIQRTSPPTPSEFFLLLLSAPSWILPHRTRIPHIKHLPTSNQLSWYELTLANNIQFCVTLSLLFWRPRLWNRSSKYNWYCILIFNIQFNNLIW